MISITDPRYDELSRHKPQDCARCHLLIDEPYTHCSVWRDYSKPVLNDDGECNTYVERRRG